MNYHNKKFKLLSKSANSEMKDEMIFHYKQQERVLTCEYEGGNIVKGHILGKVGDNGAITMSYHQINSQGEMMTGKGLSYPILLSSGKIRLHESWQWTSGDHSKGESILEEI